jgi:hypothetical protein
LSENTRRERCRDFEPLKSIVEIEDRERLRKKASPMAMPRHRFMPRIIDSSFLQQPWLKVVYRMWAC